jgi:glutathione S-transferase
LPLSNYYNKVKLALLEKGMPFHEEFVGTGPKDEAVLAASPLGKVPFIRTPDGTLCESQVISTGSRRSIRAGPGAGRPFAAAKVRELCTFIDLHLELVAASCTRRPSSAALSARDTQERVRKQLEKNIAGFKRLAKFAPYVAGDSFTLADCSAWASLPLVAHGHQGGAGRRPAGRAGIDWKPYVKLLGERASVQRVAPTARRSRKAMVAAAKKGSEFQPAAVRPASRPCAPRLAAGQPRGAVPCG